MAEPAPNLSLNFLFRQDQGVITRQIWWAGTLGLALVLTVLSDIWFAISGNAYRTLDNTPLLDTATLLTFIYLTFFALATILIGVCHYNLSAKRLRARALPTGLAGLLPLAALLWGAAQWLQPRVADVMPGWTLWAADAALAAVLAFAVAQMGVLKDAEGVPARR